MLLTKTALYLAPQQAAVLSPCAIKNRRNPSLCRKAYPTYKRE
jgi:hypothetical protein